ncbi:hypothetical protein LTR51_004603 [Lithohypha guttulata]|nr:hypothetical protein LTR51_004603 [Lithohypha guttulata]
MRLECLPPSLLALVATTLLQPVAGGLIPDLLRSLEDLQNFGKRCENPCGYYGQLCCASGEYCYTDTSGQAQCGAAGAATQVAATTVVGAGSWQYYTTTYVQTDLKTVTATFSSYISSVTQAATGISCSYAQGQSPCGNMCCNSGQYCQQAGMCVAVPGSSGYYSSLATVTVTNTATNTAGAPLRPTTNTVTTLTTTGTAASTVPYQTPVGTGGAVLTGPVAESSGGGLSGGAIAGIVIGVIAGIILLFLLCLCCCAKGLIDGFLGIFGLGPRRRRRREEVEVYEERHHHGGRTWYGAQRPETTVVNEKRKQSGLGGFGKAAVFLGGLAAILGLKRRKDHRDDKSSSGYSYYDSEYYTSSIRQQAEQEVADRGRDLGDKTLEKLLLYILL